MSLKKKIKTGLISGALICSFSTAFLAGTPLENNEVHAAVSYLGGLRVTSDRDNYLISYDLNSISSKASVTLSIMDGYGKTVKDLGTINKPTKKGTYTYTIPKSEFKKNDGIIVEYSKSNGVVLDGLAKHIILSSTGAVL